MSGATRRLLLAGAGATLLAGCGEGTWLGENTPPPLPGERKAVLLIDDQIAADPRLANLNVTLPPPVRNTDWPQLGGGPTHAPQHLEAAGALSVAWRTSVGSGAGGGGVLLGAPVVARGSVFAVDAEGTVHAVDAAGGDHPWQVYPEGAEEGDRVAGGAVAYADGRLFLAGGNGTVFALDASTGAEIWRRPVRAPIRSAPTVAEGKVLVPTADAQLFALDAGSGEVLWQHAGLFEQAGILGGASPAVENGIVVAAYPSGEVIALSLSSGEQLWSDTVLRPRRTLAIGAIADIVGDPVIAGGRVFVAGASGEMAAFDLERGVREWTADVASTQTPWLAGNFLFVLTERGELVCLVDQGGRIRWVSGLPSRVDPDEPDSRPIGWTGPVLASGRLLVASTEGELAALAPETGEKLSSLDIGGGGISVAPAVAGGTVFLLTNNATLVAVR